MSEFRIIRPRRRALRLQLLAGLSIDVSVPLLALLVYGARAEPVLLLLWPSFFVAAVGFQAVRARWTPVCVVTADGLLIGDIGGRRHCINWDQVRAAAHSTGAAGMRWDLDVGACVHSLPDLGILPERWAVL